MDNQALFDPQGHPLASLEVFRLLQYNEGNNSGRGIGCISWDGKVHAEFSPVNEIIYTGYGRVYRQVRGIGLASATFDLGECDPYFRITLIDGEGNFAHTHAYAIRDEWRVKKQ